MKIQIFAQNMANLKLSKKVLLIFHSVTHLKSNEKVIKTRNFQIKKNNKKWVKWRLR